MNMDFETFKTMTMDALQVYYGPENVEVTFQEVMKNNDMKQTGIMIRLLKEDTIGAPVIYIDKDLNGFIYFMCFLIFFALFTFLELNKDKSMLSILSQS